jgi:hypothetical protein
MKNSPDKNEEKNPSPNDRARTYIVIPAKATRKSDNNFISAPPTKPKGAKEAFRSAKKGKPQTRLTPPKPLYDQTNKIEWTLFSAALAVRGIPQSCCAASPRLVISPNRKKTEIAKYVVAAVKNSRILLVILNAFIGLNSCE